MVEIIVWRIKDGFVVEELVLFVWRKLSVRKLIFLIKSIFNFDIIEFEVCWFVNKEWLKFYV